MSTTTLVTTTNTGLANGFSELPSTSADGRYVAFTSLADNLVSGDFNGFRDVFVRDMQTGVITLVSTGASGQGDGTSLAPSISADGRFVAFTSFSTNLGADADSSADIFVRDLVLGTTTLVSTTLVPGVVSGAIDPAISPDGRYVAFSSDSSNIVAGDTNATYDIFVKDMQTGTITRIIGPNGEGNNFSRGVASFSEDGRYVGFTSFASNFAPNDGNAASDVFVYDMQTGGLTLVSAAGAGTGNGGSGRPSLSADGRFVAFTSTASNLVPGDTNGVSDIFLRDMQTGAITLVSSGASGPGNGASSLPSLSANGRFVAFESASTNLVQYDNNGFRDVFVKDLETGLVTVLSRSVQFQFNNVTGNAASTFPSIAADGTSVAFASSAEDLVGPFVDTNGKADIFAVTLDSPLLQNGTPFNDTLIGGAGADTLNGLGGDDVLIGAGVSPSNYNHLFGEAGSDTASYVGTASAVYADLRTGAGFVQSTLTDLFDSIENLTGGTGGDTLVGDDGPNRLNGGGGTDMLFGFGGDDRFLGGTAALGTQNQLFGGDGSDTVDYSGETANVYVELRAPAGYVGGVLVDLMNSVENAIGGEGDDTLVGTDADANVLIGGAGTDLLFGFGGDDELLGGSADPGQYNQLFGGDGSDTAVLADALGVVYADLQIFAAYVDVGSGLVLTDVWNSVENLVGGFAADTLAGDAGSNKLTGLGGADILYGRGGSDTFAYKSAHESSLAMGYDTIADFETGLDKIDLHALGIGAGQVLIVSGGGSTALYGDTDLETPGYELAISFVGENAVALGDLVF